ncbi:MAG TPA: DNA polymerase III subunit alpha [Conexibacter sp.]|nr:DNA polymerase III subunit alpha [Conexibacter sp.]
MSYVELHAHSAYSFLDGASLPDEQACAAAELGHGAIALTDHDNVCGAMEHAQACKAIGLRALHGAELTLDDGRHLTLLVEDERGWRNLCRLLTRAHAHTRGDVEPQMRTGGPRAGGGPALGVRLRQATDPHVPLHAVLDHAEGLVCLSGCATRGIHDRASLQALRDAFGPDHLRVELQRPYLRDDRARNRRLAALARELHLRTVATGNVHAHARARAPLQDALVAVRHHTTLDASEPLRRGNFSHVLTTPQAMAARFAADHPEAVAETAAVAERLRFDLTAHHGYRYPGEEDAHADRALAELARAKLDERYPAGGPGAGRGGKGHPLRAEALARLEEELRIIATLRLSGFFLLHRDMLELAREVALEVRGPDTARALLPPGRGRGSSVSSIVCYLTGLSHVDPIANDLFLGRFLNDELTALPDIDLDFPRDVRAALIPRIHARHGHDRSALVAAFPTYRARGAIRELGKALGLPPGEIERVARGSEGWSARDVAHDVASALGPERLAHGRWAWLARLAEQAHGIPRHLSQHPGGMVVATRPLIDCCPIVPAAMEGRQMVQWDKDSCADAGFLKIDLLGLGMLSAVERAVEEIARMRGERIDLSRIPYDDAPTYDAIQRAETTGVFQIESRAQMASLLRTRPRTLQDITIQVAIVRPGPIQGGAVNPYIERLQRLRADPSYEVPYEHPSLVEPLRETLGTIIFQDQVIEVAMAFAGFSAGEAEGLRRAMSRKRSEAAIEAHHRAFVAGAVRTHGVSEELAERVFDKVRGFSGFGFPKAHGAAFGLLAYQSTWLRVHYAPEFLCALLNEQPMGFYPPDALVHEAQRRGLTILPPDVNASEVECTVGAVGEPAGGAASGRAGGTVRIGLGYVRGVQRADAGALVAARAAGGPFRDLGELAARAGAGRSALELLAWAGACDQLAGGDRRVALWRLGVATPGRRVAQGTQLALGFDLPQAPALRRLGAWGELLADYDTTGLTARSHPLAQLRPALPRGVAASRELPRIAHGARVRVAGMVVARQRPGTASGVVFMLLEDEHGTINLIVPPKLYERSRLTVRTEPLVLAAGRLERHPAAGGGINVLVERIDPLPAPDRVLAEVRDLSPGEEAERRRVATDRGARAADDFRAVAPAVMSFAQGRRR